MLFVIIAVMTFGTLVAQGADGVSSLPGWSTAGIFGAVLAWLLWVHLPAKDKQLKDLLDGKDAQITKITDAAAEAVKEAAKKHDAVVARVIVNCQEESKDRQAEARQDRESFARSVNSAMEMLGRIHNAVRESIHATRNLDNSMQMRNRLAAAVQSLDAAAWTKSLDGVLWSWNGACEELLGWKQGEIVSKSIYATIIPPDRRDEEAEVMRIIAEGQTVDPYETWRLTKDGKRIAVLVLTSPIRDLAGKVVGASTIVKEVH